MEVGFRLNQKNIIESESEDDLFGTGFERSLNYRMERSLRYDPFFWSGLANRAIARVNNMKKFSLLRI